MRKRILAITMNTVERVSELFVGDRQQVPSFSRCPEVMETYLNALEHVFEGLIRYGSIAVPLPSWKGDSKAKCEEFVDHLQRLGLPSECFKPKDLRLNQDYRSLAAASLRQVRRLILRCSYAKLLGKNSHIVSLFSSNARFQKMYVISGLVVMWMKRHLKIWSPLCPKN